MSMTLSLLIVSALAQEPPPAADLPSAEEQALIIVYGERAKEWRGSVKSVEGVPTCKTKRSTGDAQIDAIRCGAMITCMAPISAEYSRILASDVKRKEKKERAYALLQTTLPCMDDFYDREFASLARARATQ